MDFKCKIEDLSSELTKVELERMEKRKQAGFNVEFWNRGNVVVRTCENMTKFW